MTYSLQAGGKREEQYSDCKGNEPSSYDEEGTASKLKEKEKYSIKTVRERNLRPKMREEQPPSWRKKGSTASRLDVMVMQSPG